MKIGTIGNNTTTRYIMPDKVLLQKPGDDRTPRARLLRVSQVKPGQLPFAKTTLYKFRHLNRFPGLFVKLGGLFVDLDVLDEIVEAGRIK